MSYTLSKLLQDIYTELGEMTVTTATGGSTITGVDSKQSSKHSDGDWKDGGLVVIAADGAAPEAEYQGISAYVDSSGTFTVDTAFSAAVGSGDTFGFTSDYYPLFTMIELANAGLRALGDIALVDTTTLDSITDTSEYNAATAWKRRRPLMIDYQGRSGASSDNQWVRVYDWEFVPSAPGSTGLIIFNEQIPDGRDIRIWYVDSHPRLSVFSDTISETITPELAVAAGLERALRWQNSRSGGGDDFLLQRWNDAKIELASARVRFPIWTPKRVAKLMNVGDV